MSYTVRYHKGYTRVKKCPTLFEAARFWENNFGSEVLDKTGKPVDPDTLWDALC